MQHADAKASAMYLGLHFWGPDACCIAHCHNGAVGVWVDSRLGLLTDLGRLRHLLVVHFLLVAAGHIALCARSRRRALVGHTVRLWATWSSPRRHRHTMFKVPLVAPFHERIPLGSIESRTPVTLEGGDWLQAHVDV